MKSKNIYVCENSIEGIFTGIYVAWSSNYGHENIKIEEKAEKDTYTNIELFASYLPVDTDSSLASKVASSIKNKISEEAYEIVCRVALSDCPGKADLIYRFLIIGFHQGKGVLEHLSNDVVHEMLRINRYVSREAHHWLEFLRFSEQGNGLLASVITPKNNVLTLITPHFADRFPLEKFMIYDENRQLATLHLPGKSWIITSAREFSRENLESISILEDEYRDLWKIFHHNIAIKERINPKLQRNNLPLYFRKDMTEFN